LQGAYAFTGVTMFWAKQRAVSSGTAAESAHFEFALWHRQTVAVLDDLSRNPALTDLGRELVCALHHTLGDCDAVPDDLDRLARFAAADHRIRWRAHHLAIDVDAAGRLADAFAAGAPPPPGAPPEPVLRPDRRAHWLDARSVGVRAYLAAGRCADDIAGIAGALRADALLFDGRVAEARRWFARVAAVDPGNVPAWAGLAWGEEGGPALHHRPELVVAVAQALHARGCPVRPLELAEWLGDPDPLGSPG
jgi:hypothetical protein